MIVNQGINKENAQKIIKYLKDQKLKIQTSVQGEQLRVSGKKKGRLTDYNIKVKRARNLHTFEIYKFQRLKVSFIFVVNRLVNLTYHLAHLIAG